MVAAPLANSTPAPLELCGYAIAQTLSPGQSFLAVGPGGRGVVLKKMDEDCLVRGDLHPSIRERLSRVRELAHGGVANLHGVGREGTCAYLIWDYVQGATFAQYVAGQGRTGRDMLRAARELILAVEALHARGIVHGAIGDGNVIITADGSLCLTHVSPLLYTDTAADDEAVVGLLEQAVAQRGEQQSPLGLMLSEASQEHMPLKLMGAKVAALIESRDKITEAPIGEPDRRLRRRSLLAAAAVAIVGLGVGYGVWRMMDGGSDLRASLHWVQNPAPQP